MVTEFLRGNAGSFSRLETRQLRNANREAFSKPVLLEINDGSLRTQWDIFSELRNRSVFVLGPDLHGNDHVAGVMPLVRSRRANKTEPYPVEYAQVVSTARTLLWLGAHIAAFEQGLLPEKDILREYSDLKRGIKPTSIGELRAWAESLAVRLYNNEVPIVKPAKRVSPKKTYFTPQYPEGLKTPIIVFKSSLPPAETISVPVRSLTPSERREGYIRLTTRSGLAVAVLAPAACAVLPEVIKSVTAVPPTPTVSVNYGPTLVATKPATTIPKPSAMPVSTSTEVAPQLLPSSVDELSNLSLENPELLDWGRELGKDEQIYKNISQAAYAGLSAQYPKIGFDVHVFESSAGYQVKVVGTDGLVYGENEVLLGPDGKALRDQNGQPVYGALRNVPVLSVSSPAYLKTIGLDGYREVGWGPVPPVALPQGVVASEVEQEFVSKNGIAQFVSRAKGVIYAVLTDGKWGYAKTSGIAVGGGVAGAPNPFASPTLPSTLEVGHIENGVRFTEPIEIAPGVSVELGTVASTPDTPSLYDNHVEIGSRFTDQLWQSLRLSNFPQFKTNQELIDYLQKNNYITDIDIPYLLDTIDFDKPESFKVGWKTLEQVDLSKVRVLIYDTPNWDRAPLNAQEGKLIQGPDGAGASLSKDTVTGELIITLFTQGLTGDKNTDNYFFAPGSMSYRAHLLPREKLALIFKAMQIRHTVSGGEQYAWAAVTASGYGQYASYFNSITASSSGLLIAK